MSARLMLIVIIFSFLTTIALAQGTLAPGFYDDTNAALFYPNGAGQICCIPPYYLETTSYADRLEFDITGAGGFRIYGEKFNGTAPIEVCVDGNCDVFSLSGISNGYIGALLTVSGLSSGNHEVVIRVNPDGLGFPYESGLSFDAVEVLAPPPPTSTPSNTPVPTNTAVPTATNTPVPSATPDSPHLTIPIDAEDLENFFDWFRIIFGLVLPIALLGAGLTAGAIFAFALGRILKKYIESLKDGS